SFSEPERAVTEATADFERRARSSTANEGRQDAHLGRFCRVDAAPGAVRFSVRFASIVDLAVRITAVEIEELVGDNFAFGRLRHDLLASTAAVIELHCGGIGSHSIFTARATPGSIIHYF